jgi:hypothetical protein
VIKGAALVGGTAVLAGYNAAVIVLGLSSGAVRTLGRRGGLVRYEADAAGFAFNLCLRTVFVLLFTTVAVLLYRQLRRDSRL